MAEEPVFVKASRNLVFLVTSAGLNAQHEFGTSRWSRLIAIKPGQRQHTQSISDHVACAAIDRDALKEQKHRIVNRGEGGVVDAAVIVRQHTDVIKSAG